MSTQATTDAPGRALRPGKFVWFEHVSRDPGRAQAFYANVLGWSVERWGDTDDDMLAVMKAIPPA